MHRSHSAFRFLPPFLLLCSLLAVYLRTLAPGITWANDSSDGGDLIAAAATGGVAHPTGYPLYLLLARAFQALPLGSLAFRTNLMSAVAAGLGALLVYAIVRQSSSGAMSAWLSGLAAALAFGLAPLVWSQAVVTEVYALQACLTALVLYLYAATEPSTSEGRKRLDRWRGLALGLALSNQIVTVLFVPVALVLGSLEDTAARAPLLERGRSWPDDLRWNGASLRRQLAFLALGASLYLLLPLRAWTRPLVNWGDVTTPGRLWWLVSGELYQSYYLQIDPAGVWERIQAFAALMIRQFGLAGLIVGVIGLVIFGRRSRLYILSAWIALVSLVFAVLYGSRDSYVYLVPLLVSFAVWIGLGIAGSERIWGSPLRGRGLALGLIAIGYFALRPVAYLAQVDASADRRADIFGRQVLFDAPQGAILLAEGDRAVFTLWYFHYALGERPDAAVVAVDLLQFDWYQQNLRVTYPSLKVPGPALWPETLGEANPSRPACTVRYTDHLEMTCSGP